MLFPPFFWEEGWLIASKRSSVIPVHWVSDARAQESGLAEDTRE